MNFEVFKNSTCALASIFGICVFYSNKFLVLSSILYIVFLALFFIEFLYMKFSVDNEYEKLKKELDNQKSLIKDLKIEIDSIRTKISFGKH